MKKLIIILLLCLGSISSVAQGNIESGKQKSLSCAACHGPDGNSTNGAWPNLAGQHPHYLVTQMQAFKQGRDAGRYNTIMTPLMVPLSVQDMEDLAAFYASQKIHIGAADPTLLKQGEALYRGGDFSRHIAACIACHGPSGDGNNLANFPKLSGQHALYTEQQLKLFKEGARSNDLNRIMRDIASRLDEKESAAVSSYISGLH